MLTEEGANTQQPTEATVLAPCTATLLYLWLFPRIPAVQGGIWM